MGHDTYSILVVHDDPAILAGVRKLLEGNGLMVDEARSYAAIDAKAKSGKYDAVLCEMWMSTMDGMKVQAMLRRASASYEGKLVFASVNLPTDSGLAIIPHQNLPYMIEPADLIVKLRAISGQRPIAQAGTAERRRYRRMGMKGKVRVVRKQFSTGQPDVASIINVSRTGILFASSNPYWVGAEVLVAYPYPDPTSIEQEGVVVRVDEGKNGSRQVAIRLAVP